MVRGTRQPTPAEYLDHAVEENVRLNVEKLKKSSPVIAKLVEEGKVKVVGAVYQLESGRIDFLSCAARTVV